MERARKMSITLPASLAKAVEATVKTGDYASNSEVIRAALRFWQEDRMERQRAIDEMRALVDEAIIDPRPLRTPRQVADRLDRMDRATAKVRRRAG